MTRAKYENYYCVVLYNTIQQPTVQYHTMSSQDQNNDYLLLSLYTHLQIISRIVFIIFFELFMKQCRLVIQFYHNIPQEDTLYDDYIQTQLLDIFSFLYYNRKEKLNTKYLVKQFSM